MRILFSVLLIFGVFAKTWAEQNDSPATVPATPNNAATPAENKQSVTFKSLAQMNELIELGVPALALSLLDGEQNKRPAFSADWYTFEYKRIVLMSALERWNKIVERTQWLFDTAKSEGHITRKIRLWFETQQVIARLQLKQSEQALNQLQYLLWSTEPEHRDPSLPVVWRRLVIRAYLQLEADDDARRALVKYERDYKTDESNIDWVLLQAQLLLKTQRPQQAIQLLEKIPVENAVDIEALLLIAKLQNDPKSAKKINQQMREKLDGQVLSQSARWAYSYVAYLAAKVLSDNSAQISNLEVMLSLGIEYPLFDDNYQVTADDLWDLYNKQGLMAANDSGLLFGNDEQWQKLSEQLINKDPEKALALNVALVLHTDKFVTSNSSIKQL